VALIDPGVRAATNLRIFVAQLKGNKVALRKGHMKNGECIKVDKLHDSAIRFPAVHSPTIAFTGTREQQNIAAGRNDTEK
jgi:hypothetical protein